MSKKPSPLKEFCAALDAEREAAGLSKQYLARQLGLSAPTMTELLKGAQKKAPSWQRVARILEECWEATHPPSATGSGRAAVRATHILREEYLQTWRIRHGVLEHELQRPQPQDPGQTPLPQTPIVHHGHALLGSIPLMCRSNDSTRLAQWNAAPSERNVLCLTGPGGQGKSALAWTHLMDENMRRIRIWHSFSDDQDPRSAFTATLARAARQAFGSHEEDEGAAAVLHQRLAETGGLIVLDGLEHLYGPSGRLLDAISSKYRTIADPRVEDRIRSLIALTGVKVLITCRLTPSFLDDPTLRDQVERLELSPIDADAARPFWEGMRIRGSTGQLATATAALHGSPILMRLVARRVISRRDGDIGAWLVKEKARITRTDDVEVLSQLVPVQILSELTDTARRLLLLLAVSRRRLSPSQWSGLRSGGDSSPLRADREPAPDEAEDEVFDEAVFSLLDNDLIHRDSTGEYDLHEVLADAIIAHAEEAELRNAYRDLSRAEGFDLYMPGMGWQWNQLDHKADPASIARNRGRFLSLLDRGAFESAAHILTMELYPALRHRLCDLRQLRTLAARFDAALARSESGGGDPHFEVELALADGDWDEIVALLDDADRNFLDPFDLLARAEARSGREEFGEAYKDASTACFRAWRQSSLEEAADGYADSMDVNELRAFWGVRPQCSGYHSAVAAQLVLSRVLRTAGFRRSALLVLISSFPRWHSHPDELAAHWEECGRILAELGQSELAREACRLSLRHAEDDKSTERLMHARTLELELRAHADQLESTEVNVLLAEATKLGLGVLARRLLALHGQRDGLFAAVAWQYHTDLESLPGPQPRPAAADDLWGELDLLSELRAPGQWVELTLLENAIDAAGESGMTLPGGSVRGGIAEEGRAILTQGWRAAVGERWGEQATRWVEGWEPSADVPPHDAAMHRLDLVENDLAAAQTLAAAWMNVDHTQAFERLERAVYYEPGGWEDEEEILDAMISSARSVGRLPDAAWALRYLMSEGWMVPETGLRAIGLYREIGDYDNALYLSLAAGAAANVSHPAGLPTPPQIRIALVLGAGLDLLALGIPPAVAVNAVEKGLAGFPMAEGDDPFSQRFQVLGAERKADTAARPDIVGGTFGVVHELHRGTAGHAALELFQKIAGSGGTGDTRVAEWLAQATRFDVGNDPQPDATAHFALSLVPGHDDLKARLDK